MPKEDIILKILETMKEMENNHYKQINRLIDECSSLWQKCANLQERIEKLESDKE